MHELVSSTRDFTLHEALTALEEKTGLKWQRNDFFAGVVRLSLRLRSATPATSSTIMHTGAGRLHVVLPNAKGRPMAAMLTRHVHDLWHHGEASTDLVVFEEGQPGFLTWEQVTRRRKELDREATDPEVWNSKWPDSDWHDGDFMGESDSVFLSEVVTVTDLTVRVPAEAIDELLAGFKPRRPSVKAAESGLVKRQVRRLTANSIDALIERAIGLAGCVDTGPVFLHLKELALQEVPPFTGRIDGDSLIYTSDQNNLTKLSKDLLRRRLKRRVG